jgi:hypothetical protein
MTILRMAIYLPNLIDIRLRCRNIIERKSYSSVSGSTSGKLYHYIFFLSHNVNNIQPPAIGALG